MNAAPALSAANPLPYSTAMGELLPGQPATKGHSLVSCTSRLAGEDGWEVAKGTDLDLRPATARARLTP